MARNYSLTEATKIIVANEDATQLVELGKRFPLLVSMITRIAVKAGEELDELMQFIPENLSANKVNQNIKKSLESDTNDEDEEFEDGDEVEEVSVKKNKKAIVKNDKGNDNTNYDYDNMNTSQMYKLLGELGKRKDCKEKFGDFSKASMLGYLKKYGPNTMDIDDEVEEDDDFEEEVVSYEGMKATELFKLCKERKLKVEVRKPAKYYISKLKEADEAANNVDDEADDWDEEEEEAPVKKNNKSNKATAKSTSKNKPKQQKEEDDDEDWDI